jgi:hypothetical protein
MIKGSLTKTEGKLNVTSHADRKSDNVLSKMEIKLLLLEVCHQ